jgi:hypothetical protein
MRFNRVTNFGEVLKFWKKINLGQGPSVSGHMPLDHAACRFLTEQCWRHPWSNPPTFSPPPHVRWQSMCPISSRRSFVEKKTPRSPLACTSSRVRLSTTLPQHRPMPPCQAADEPPGRATARAIDSRPVLTPRHDVVLEKSHVQCWEHRVTRRLCEEHPVQ